MTKTQAINYINSRLGAQRLSTRNTTFARISSTRSAWWMNINLQNFQKDWNIVLVGENELMWLKIPAGTFNKPDDHFKIWEAKNAVDVYISSNPTDRYLKDVASGATGVDFKSFIVEKFSIPQEMKHISDNKPLTTQRPKPELISFTSVPNLNAELQKQRIIKQDQTDITYEKIFGRYLKGADVIKLQDPWIRLQYQFNNLLEFCVMLGNSNEPGKTIKLEVVSWNSKEFRSQSIGCFEEIAAAVQEMGIYLAFTFEKHHDRYIEANNGCKIILGRGLDIFEKREGRFSIGDVDQRWRKCKACEITYLQKNSTLSRYLN